MRFQLPGFVLILLLSACSDKSATTVATEQVIAAAEAEEIRGFVFSHWAYEIPKEDPGECPDGFNITEEEFLSEDYAKVSDEVKRRYESGQRRTRRLLGY